MRVNRGELERDPSSSPSGRPAGAPRAPDPFVGGGPALADFLARLSRAAASESTVLVLGESGTGKGRAAERLHRSSPRSAGPFVAASLVATSATLIESTLFGHERGAFTDAHKNRLGLFRRAQGGTLLLDGIDHLALLAARDERAFDRENVFPAFAGHIDGPFGDRRHSSLIPMLGDYRGDPLTGKLW